MADSTDLLSTSSTLDSLSLKTKDLTASAGGFARAMTQAFSASVTGGKQFDDVLKSLALRISDLAVRLAFKPLEKSLDQRHLEPVVGIDRGRRQRRSKG